MRMGRAKTDELDEGLVFPTLLRDACRRDPSLCAMIVERMKAPPLLLCGAAIWIMAFTFVYVVEWALVLNPFNEEYFYRYPSGLGYISSTFSDLSHRHSSVQASVFQNFGMVSAISIQTSWYTELLRNVHTQQQRVRFLGVRWSWFRFIVPTMGMILISGVPTVPTIVWMVSPGKCLLTRVLVNGLGCWSVFLSYTFSELHCLGYCEFLTVQDDSAGSLPHLSAAERKWRLWSVSGAVLCCILFLLVQVVLFLVQQWCPGVGKGGLNTLLNEHCDEWAPVGAYVGLKENGVWSLVEPDFEGRRVEIQNRPEVINTASGVIALVKAASLTFEYVGMVMFCLNIFAIWYFCEERHFHREYLCVDGLDTEPVEPSANEAREQLASNFGQEELAQMRISLRPKTRP